MNKFKTLLFLAVFGGIGLWGCDDSSSASSNGPDENATVESSSSSICKDCDDESSSSAKKIESSAEKDVVASSDAKSNSSSSSSKKNDTSSSSQRDDSLSSSSSYVHIRCNENERDTVVKDWGVKYYRCENNDWVLDTTIYIEKPKEYPVMDSLFETKYSTYGEFEDPRDHQSYKTVILNMHDGDGKIVEGEKIEVFAQNLNYGEMIDTSIKIHDDTKVEKYCDLNDEWFCDNGWGGRYTWSEAMGLSAKYDSILWKDTVGGDSRIHQGLCPGGWHIMNAYEWKNYTSKGGLALSSKVNWWPVNMSGANLLGLSVLFQMKTYDVNWNQAWFILPSEKDNDAFFYVLVNEKYVYYSTDYVLGKHITVNVRCVRDYQ